MRRISDAPICRLRVAVITTLVFIPQLSDVFLDAYEALRHTLFPLVGAHAVFAVRAFLVGPCDGCHRSAQKEQAGDEMHSGGSEPPSAGAPLPGLNSCVSGFSSGSRIWR